MAYYRYKVPTGRYSLPKSYDPYASAQTTVAHNIERLRAAGIKPPELSTHPTLWSQIINILDRPGAAVRGALYAAITPEKESILGEAWKGLTGKQSRSGEDILRAVGIPKTNNLVDWMLATATEIVTDPLTYASLGTTSLAKKSLTESTETIAKRIAKEVATETGKKISGKSAMTLAENALKGNIPIGRIGTAVQRAIGNQADTVKILSKFNKIEKDAAKVSATKLLGKSYKKYETVAKRLEKAAKKGDVPKSIANNLIQKLRSEPKQIAVTRVVGEIPRYNFELGTFMGFGKPVIEKDITNVVNAIRKYASAVAGKPGEKAFNVLGYAFVRDYTPTTLKGTQRVLFTKAKGAIGAAERIAPSSARLAVTDVLKDWKKSGISEEARRMASYVIEERKSPEFKALKKATLKLETAKKDLAKLITENAPASKIAGKRRSVNTWLDKVATAQEALDERRLRIFGSTEIPEEYVRAANKATKLFNEDIAKLAEHGVPVHVIDNYVYHLYKDPPEVVKAKLTKWYNMKGISAARPAFMRKRVIPTLEEAIELGLHPIEDVAIQNAVHRAVAEQSIVLQKLGRDLLNIGSEVIRPANRAPSDWIPLTDMTIPILNKMAVHPEIEKSLRRMYSVVTNPDDASKVFGKLYNTAMRHLKGLMTVWNPAFHVRQLTGNVFLNMVDGVINPADYADAAKVLRGNASIKVGNKTISGDIVKRLFMREGLAGQGAVRYFESPKTLREVATTQAKFMKLTPASLRDKLRYPAEAGIAVDTFSRMANFVHHLKEGLSPTAAADKVRAALYDYGALSEFERTKLRNIFPFYAWVRFNTPAMLKLLATRPGVMLGLQHAIESGKDVFKMSDEEIPTWIRDSLAIPIGTDEKGNYKFLNLSLPPADISRIHMPSDWAEGLREFVSMANPLVTVPIQIAQNRILFSDMPITKYPDVPMQRLKDSLNFALSQLGPAREIMTARRYAAQAAAGKTPATKHTPGLGTTVVYVNPEAVKQQRMYELRDLLQQVIQMKKAQGVPIPDYKDIAPRSGRYRYQLPQL